MGMLVVAAAQLAGAAVGTALFGSAPIFMGLTAANFGGVAGSAIGDWLTLDEGLVPKLGEHGESCARPAPVKAETA